MSAPHRWLRAAAALTTFIGEALVEKDNKRKRGKRQSSQPDLLKLAAGLRSPDPIEANPFPPDDPRHRVWQDATLRAEREVHEANATYLKMLGESLQTVHPNEERLVTLGRVGYLVIAKFDAWAFRGLHVVWDETALADFDQWLEADARSWVATMWDHLSPGGAAEAEWQLHYLHLGLIRRVEFWKSEARKYLLEQKEEGANEAVRKSLANAERAVHDYKTQTLPLLLRGEFLEIRFRWGKLKLKCIENGLGEPTVDQLRGVEDWQPPPPKVKESPVTVQPAVAPLPESEVSVDRVALLEGYCDEVKAKKGKRPTLTSIAKLAHYSDLTELRRWRDRDPKYKPNKEADTKFMRILTVEKPHLK